MTSANRFGVVANILSISRLPLGLLLTILYVMGVGSAGLIVCAIVLWSTDTLDGIIARYGVKQGATPRTDGKILDPLMDDAAITAGFVILLYAHVIPVWFLIAVLFSRSLFILVRIMSLARGLTFPASIPITKVSCTCLAIGQICLLTNVNTASPALSALVVKIIILTMCAILAVSCYFFLIRQNSPVLAGLFKTEKLNSTK